MDAPAVPTFADKGPPAKRAAIPRVTEEQLAFFEQVGMIVPPEQEPDGFRLGDTFWTSAEAHTHAAVFRGELYTVPYVLIVPSRYAKERDWHAVLHEAVLPVHEQLSPWNPESAISVLNREGCLAQGLPPLLDEALRLCEAVFDASEGLFDPSIGPVAEAWSTALETRGTAPDSRLVHELMCTVVGLRRVWAQGRLAPGARLGLDAVAKGFAADLVAKRLASLTESFFFDWGGEAVCAGRHPSGRPWRTGILRPPSLHSLFQSWRFKTAPELTQALARLDLPATGSAWATSGDYGQGKRFGFFHIASPRTGMLMQAAGGSVASVTVQGRSCAVCDALATAAMVFPAPQQAHAWLHRVAAKFQVTAFYVVSRSMPLLSHKTPPSDVPVFDVPLVGGFVLSEETSRVIAAGQREVLIATENREVAVSTARVASLSPLLVSLLVPESLSLKRFSFCGLLCVAMHKSGPLVLASAMGQPVDESVSELRRRTDTAFVASVRMGDAVLERCSSLAVLEGVVSFNVEQHSRFGLAVAEARPGTTLSVTVPPAIVIECAIRNVATCGDHVLVLCGVLHD
jgi:thiamine biosynthesis lipoprotein